jgi:hypothetical protein
MREQARAKHRVVPNSADQRDKHDIYSPRLVELESLHHAPGSEDPIVSRVRSRWITRWRDGTACCADMSWVDADVNAAMSPAKTMAGSTRSEECPAADDAPCCTDSCGKTRSLAASGEPYRMQRYVRPRVRHTISISHGTPQRAPSLPRYV